MIEDLLSHWLGPKFLYQFDLGNIVVGLATAFLAFVAISSNRSISRQKIAEFRQIWIEDLRGCIAEHGKTAIDICYLYTSKKTDDTNLLLNEKYSRLSYLEGYIRLKLNPNEKLHLQLIKYLFELRQHTKKIRDFDKVKEHAEIFNSIKLKCLNCSKKVLKLEWDRLKDEVHGRSLLNRKIRNFFRSFRKDASAEWPQLTTSTELET